MLTNHRRAIGWSAVLFGAMIFVFVAVGRHPPELAPKTTLPFVGEFDLSVYHWMDDIRNGVLTLLARVLNVLGGGIVTIPLRVVVAVWRIPAAWLLQSCSDAPSICRPDGAVVCSSQLFLEP